MGRPAVTAGPSSDSESSLARIAAALERLAPAPAVWPDLAAGRGFVFDRQAGAPRPAERVAAPPLDVLQGVESQAERLLANTRRFAAGRPAHHALLWGARGMGKSSLVKAVYCTVADERAAAGDSQPPALVEIYRDDIAALPELLRGLAAHPRRFIVFCDDLSFDGGENDYKALKAALEGGLEGTPANVALYATSNRRHMMPRAAIDSAEADTIQAGEAADEKVALSDRFGLWVGFHPCDAQTYLAMVESYADRLGLAIDRASLHAQAREWAVTRGGRSGRVAWQFIVSLAGAYEVSVARLDPTEG